MTKSQSVEKKNVQMMLKKAKADQQQAKKKNNSGTKKNNALSTQQGLTKRVPKATDDQMRKKAEAEVAQEESQIPEPPFQFEVHVKRKILYMRVQLHKIPHQYINIESTTDKQVVIDTTKYTKKFRLVFPLPDSMSIESAKGEYDFESGVLRCTFPIKNMPAGESTRIQQIIAQQKQSRKIRFEHQLDQTSGLETRVRTKKMNLSESQMSKQKQKRRERQEENDDDEDDVDVDGAVSNKTMSSTKEAMLLKKIESASQRNKNDLKKMLQVPSSKKQQKDKKTTTTKSTKTAAATAASENPKSKYVSDSEGAKQIAESVSKSASKSIKESVTKIKKLEAAQNQKKQRSLNAHQRKKDVLNRSFLDILKQKQDSVRKQAEAARPVERKPKNENSKSVSFA